MFDGNTSIINQTRPLGTYVNITQSVTITAGVGILQEIPNRAAGIILTVSSTPVATNDATIGQLPTNSIISVDWDQGLIFTTPAYEGLSIVANFIGMGAIFLSSHRVFTQNSGNTITQTLADIVGAASGFIFLSTYSNSTTYQKYNIVSYQGASYACTATSSLGNLPTNTSFFTKIAGTIFRNTYNSGTSYAISDYVLNATGDALYVSIVDGNVGQSLTDTTKWLPTISFLSVTAAEVSRVAAETGRVTAESGRSSAETTRSGNETTRQSQEATRVSQETARETKIAGLVNMGNYLGSTAYSVLNFVNYNGTMYQCTTAGVGNTPSSSSTFWKKMNNYINQGQWNSGVTYFYGDVVYDSVNQNLYMSIVDNNLNQALTLTSKWQLQITVAPIISTLNTTNTNVTNAESSRVTAESGRVTAESGRTSAESARVSSEITRSGNEATRQSNETARIGRDTAYQLLEAYNNTHSYVPLNKVTLGGQTFQCILATTGNTPPNSTYWTLIAAKGTDGATNTINHIYTATTAGQTTFSISGGYTVGLINMYMNGTRLQNGNDFTATDGSNVVLTSSVTAGQEVEFEIIGYVGVLPQVTAVNGRTGNVVISSSDITTGLGFTPIDSATIGNGANQIAKHDANGIIQNAGNQITSKSANATLLLTESGIIDVTTAASTITITLPSAATSQVSYVIKKVDSGAGSITIATTSSQLIDGVSTKFIAYQYGYIQVVSDGTGWQIIDGSTNVTSSNTDISISSGLSNPVLTLNSANSGANKILKLDGSGNTSADIIIDGATNKAYTAAEKTKLAGVATGATANTGTVTSVTSANTDASIATTTTTPVITINTGSGANQIVKRDGSGNINATTVTTNANLTGDVTSVGNTTTLTNAPVIAKVLTGYTSGAGTITAADSILQAIQKLNGNDATNANLTGMVTSVGNATTVVTNANLTGDVTSVGNATTIANTGAGANQFPKRDANGNILNIGNQITALSVNTTLTPAQSGIINVTTGSSVITITLPTAATSQLVYTIKKVDSGSGTVLIATTSSQTIDGVLTKTLVNQNANITLVSDGSNWIVDIHNTLDKIGLVSLTTTAQELNSAVNEVQKMPVNTMSRQALINGNMDIAQINTTFTNPANNAYTLDMWVNLFTNTGTLPTTITHTQTVLTVGELYNSYYSYQVSPNGAGSGFGVSDAYGQAQRIEYGTRVLCGNGKKVTISINAKSSIATKRIAVGLKQVYGTGGSPTAAEILTPTSTTVRSLTTTMAQYTFTFTTNTLTGKTFGTNNDDYLELAIYEMWGSTFATNNLGGGTAETFVGSGNINFTQAVLNSGDQPLAFQPKSLNDELLACLRYYENSYATGVAVGTADGFNEMMGSLIANDSTYLMGSLSFKVRKRVNPVISLRALDSPSGSGTINNVRDDSAGGLVNISGCSFVKNQWGIRKIFLTTAFVANHTYAFSWEADARL